ncbi:MAG TPA: tetratricopeptide repeat protein [Pirellulales bacterium]|jgi:tetratricopeptide (TPR) repeat protein|nr:tetratricopeptide repeat protein [Pirellulales bacterium]
MSTQVTPALGRPVFFRRGVVLLVAAALAFVAWWAAPGALVRYDVLRARRALAELEPDEACRWLQAAEARSPERAEVHYLLGSAHRRARRYRPAKQCFERAERLGWSKRDLERERMMMTFQMGQVERAEPYLRKLLEQDCGDEVAEDIYEALVMGYLTEFRVSEASTCLTYWVEWRPDSVRARVWRAQFYGSMHDEGKLQAELREVLRIDPGRLGERMWLAQSLVDQNQVEAALAECEIGRRQAPVDPRVSLVLGLCRFKQGRQDEAQRELEAAAAKIADPPRKLQALVLLGQIASAEGDYERAVRHYEAATQCNPGDASAEYGLGTALSNLGNPQGGEPHLKRSHELERQLNRLNEISSALVKDIENVELRLEASHIALDQGRKNDAAVWMLSALRYDPMRREAHEFLADYYQAHGEVDLAQTHRDMARRGGKLTGASTPDPSQRRGTRDDE